MTTLVLLILPRLHRQVLKRFQDNPCIAHPLKATQTSIETFPWQPLYCSSIQGYTDKYWNVFMTTLVVLILPMLHRQILKRFNDNPCIAHPSWATQTSIGTFSWQPLYCSSFEGYTDKYWNVSMKTLVLFILPRLHGQVLERFHDNPCSAHPSYATQTNFKTFQWQPLYSSSFLGYTDKYWNVSMTTLVLLILWRLHRQVLERFHENPCIVHPS